MAEQLTCAICRAAIEGMVHTIGPRHDCEQHYQSTKRGYKPPVDHPFPESTVMQAVKWSLDEDGEGPARRMVNGHVVPRTVAL